MRRIGEPLHSRRARFEKSVGEERWLVSYADFITLLFAFFVVMYSISQVSESKYRSLSETLSTAFPSSALDQSEASVENNLADLTQLEQTLTEQLSGYPIEGELRLSANENWLELTLSSEMLFASGAASPNQNASDIFAELSGVLGDIENEVQIVGHTDNVPINNTQFENNWALSSARAVSIVNVLVLQGIDPGRLSATGYGEYRPVDDNATAEGREKNRRVVVRIGSSASTQNSLESVNDINTASSQTQSSEANAEEVTRLDVDPSQRAGDQANSQISESGSDSDKPLQNGIQPVRLQGGDLLFTSDPDLPRTREREE